MGTLWRRRGAVFCLVFVYTGFAAAFLSYSLQTILFFTAATGVAAFSLSPIRRKTETHLGKHSASIIRLVLCAIGAALLFFGISQALTFTRIERAYDGTKAQITATVLEKSYTSAFATGYLASARTESGDTFRIVLETSSDVLCRGDVIECSATLSAFPEHSGTFPERRYYRSMSAVLRGEADTFTVLRQDTDPLTRIAAFRDTMLGILHADLGREDSALAAALFLGERHDLADSLLRDFRRLGVSHLLAISGLHFTLLLSALDKVLTLFMKSRKLRTVLLILADIGYMLLCGMTESVVRAGIMMLLTYAAILVSRKSDVLSSLGAASFLMCLTDPAAVYSVALQLSVTSVLALFAADRIMRRLRTESPQPRFKQIARGILSAFLLPVAVQTVLLPLLCLYFGEVSLLTPISTLLLSPLAELLLLLTPLYLLLHPILPLASLLGAGMEAVSRVTAAIAASLASLRGITLSLTYPFAPIYAAVLCAAILTAPFHRNKKSLRRHLGGTLVIFLLFLLSVTVTDTLARDQVKIASISAGKNDAVVVSHRKDFLLIDVSDGSYSALSSAYSAAAASGATEVESLYLSHLHTRHVTSIARFTDTVYVRSLILPSPQTAAEEQTVRALKSLCSGKGIPVYVYTAADMIDWGDTIEILPTKTAYLKRSTQPLTVFSIRANGSVFTYFGASAGEASVYADQTDADVIVFGGHGPLVKTDTVVTLSPHLRNAVLRPNAGDLPHGIPDGTTVFADDGVHVFVFTP